MADLKISSSKAVEAGVIGGSAGIIAINAGNALDAACQSHGVSIPSGTGFVVITTVVPAIYKFFRNLIKHRRSRK